MDYDEARKLVKSRLGEKRWTHTKNVKKMAVKLAKRWSADPEKAAMAAILHDSAKELPKQELLQIFADNAIIAENAPARPSPVWHGIAAAILALLEDQKTVAEGAGAVSVAAVMFGKVDLVGKNTVCVVSGGNVDVTTLSRIITKGLSKTGRITEFTVKIADKPGSLVQLLQTISKTGANILSVNHAREDKHSDIGACVVSMVLETRNRQHVDDIERELQSFGYHILEK